MEVLDSSVVEKKQFHTFLQAISMAAYLQKALGQIWEETRQIVQLPPNTSYVLLKQDISHLVGMPFVEEKIIPVKYYIYIDITSKRSIYKGGWLMLYVFDLRTRQFFYWTTEMATVYQRGTDHDFTQAGQFGRLGFSNASGGGGVRVTSSSN